MLPEDRIKVKQYQYERDALKKWLQNDDLDVSTHVVNAVRGRLSIVERQIEMIS